MARAAIAPQPMDSHQIARYLEDTNSQFKPWLLVQLRLAKLKEQRDRLDPADYALALADVHQDLMNLGEWWIGREGEAFGTEPPEPPAPRDR
jgi:hypothetical protein